MFLLFVGLFSMLSLFVFSLFASLVSFSFLFWRIGTIAILTARAGWALRRIRAVVQTPMPGPFFPLFFSPSPTSSYDTIFLFINLPLTRFFTRTMFVPLVNWRFWIFFLLWAKSSNMTRFITLETLSIIFIQASFGKTPILQRPSSWILPLDSNLSSFKKIPIELGN